MQFLNSTDQRKLSDNIPLVLTPQTYLLLPSQTIIINKDRQNVLAYKDQDQQQLKYDMLNIIYNQCQFQYDFFLFSIIDERDALIERKYEKKNYQDLIQIDEELSSFRNQFNKLNQKALIYGKQLFDPQQFSSLYIKLRNLQNLLSKFKAKKILRIIKDFPISQIDQDQNNRFEPILENQVERLLIQFKDHLQNQYPQDTKFQIELRSFLQQNSQYFINTAPQLFKNKQYQNSINKYTLYSLINRLDPISELKIAICLYKLKKYGESQEQLNNLLQRSQNKIYIWYYLGIIISIKANIYKVNKQYDKAIVLYDKIIEIWPQFTKSFCKKGKHQSNIIKAKIYKTLQDKQENSMYDIILKLQPNNQKIIQRQVMWYYSNNLYKEALQKANLLISLNPKNDSYYNNKGCILYNQNLILEAQQCYEKSVQLNPNSSAFNNQGLLQEKLLQSDKALRFYNKAIELDPSDHIAYVNKGQLLKKLGRLDEALLNYDYAIQLNPQDDNIFKNKGSILFTQGRFDEALQAFNKAIELNPQNDSHHNSMGVLLQQLGRMDEAISFFDKALKLNHLDSDYNNNKGLILQKLGKFEEAIQYYDKAIQLNPQNDKAYSNKAILIKQLGRIDEAILLYDKALQLNPNNFTTYNNKGILLSQLGRLDEALKLYDQAIQLNPRDENFYYNKGSVLILLGKVEEAIKCCDYALTLNPQNDNSYNSKGLLLKKLGRFEEAIQIYNQAIQINPNQDCYFNNKGSNYITLGILLEAMGRLDQAIQHYDQAIKINPLNDIVYSNKGSLLVRQGKNEEALVCYEKSLQINPKNQITHDNITLLKRHYFILGICKEDLLQNILERRNFHDFIILYLQEQLQHNHLNIIIPFYNIQANGQITKKVRLNQNNNINNGAIRQYDRKTPEPEPCMKIEYVACENNKNNFIIASYEEKVYLLKIMLLHLK